MYRFYFGNIPLPVAPGEMTTKIKNQNKTITLVSEGELNILKSPGLTGISFSLLLPHAPLPFAVYENGFKGPDYYLDLFEKLKTERRAFDFSVLRSLDSGAVLPWGTSMKCALEEYSIKESAAEGFDFTVDLKLRQYVAYGVKTLTIKGNEATEETDRDTADKPAQDAKSYTIRDGDSLWGIARTQLGDGARWTELYALNKKVLDAAATARGMPAESGSRWIFTGTVIRLPK